MANIASQKKRILRSERERTENRLLTSTVKTHFRRLKSAVEAGDAEQIASEHTQLVSRIDKAVQKGALHKNTGAREVKGRPRRGRLLSCSRGEPPGSAPARLRSRRRHGTRLRGRQGLRSACVRSDSRERRIREASA